MRVTVIGLGKIGLPLAVQFASKGCSTVGLDVNSDTVSKVNLGLEPFPEEVGLDWRIKKVVEDKLLYATTDAEEAIRNSNVIVVAVPLFTDALGNADFQIIDSVTSQIARHMQSETLICFETTLPIGTTRNRFTKILEKERSLTVGEDFYVVFSPERVLTGRIFSDLRKYPKIVGGVSKQCTPKGVEFYRKVLDFDDRTNLPRPNGVWNVGDAETAEFVKLAETTYRDVNIGLANQFAIFANRIGVDIAQVIQSANSQDYSFIHQPGISVGGHCIPIYPQFYLQNDPGASIVRSAREVNKGMPSFYVEMLREIDQDLNNKTILVLGVSYRPNVKETAYSGALDVRSKLNEFGISSYYLDPLYSSKELEELGFSAHQNGAKYDFILIHTAHSEFLDFNFKAHSHSKKIVDGRNLLGKGLGVVEI